jgi:hypothetical protein
VRAREREGVYVFVRGVFVRGVVCVCARARAFVRACVRSCVCVCVRACMYDLLSEADHRKVNRKSASCITTP